MENFIKIELGKLKKHHNKRFDEIEKKILKVKYFIGLGTLILLILQIINLYRQIGGN